MKFFRSQGTGEGLPYLREFILCAEFHWSWQQLQATPAPVLAYWQVYLEQRGNARRLEQG